MPDTCPAHTEVIITIKVPYVTTPLLDEDIAQVTRVLVERAGDGKSDNSVTAHAVVHSYAEGASGPAPRIIDWQHEGVTSAA